LGAKALQYMRGTHKDWDTSMSISEYRGNWVFIPKYRAWCISTYHPSYILRLGKDNPKVKEFEEDIARLANTWHTVVNNDYRMQMSESQWESRLFSSALEI